VAACPAAGTGSKSAYGPRVPQRSSTYQQRHGSLGGAGTAGGVGRHDPARVSSPQGQHPAGVAEARLAHRVSPHGRATKGRRPGGQTRGPSAHERATTHFEA